MFLRVNYLLDRFITQDAGIQGVLSTKYCNGVLDYPLVLWVSDPVMIKLI